MTLVSPWALIGLLAMAVPVIVHWLARHQARRIRFPTIQFLMRSSPVSVRHYRLRDKRLLAVRMAIIAAAAVALAQPVWVRPGAPAARPARAVVVDTSASLRRPLADGGAGRLGLDAARDTAAGIEAPGVTIATERVAEGVAQAAAWLARQAPPRELVVVSDFQVGALVESDLDTVPEDAQVRLIPIAVSGPVPAAPAPARGQLRVLVGREQAGRAAAAEAAAKTSSELVSGTAQENELGARFSVSVVFPSAANREELWSSAQPVDTPELFDLVADIRKELGRLGQSNELGGDFRKIASELLVFTDIDPGSEQAAALMAAILRAAAPATLSDAEREPDTLTPAVLDGWQRTGAPESSAARAGDRSDGRWFWGLALVLFGVEAAIRRRPTRAQTESEHAHAA